MDKWTEGQLLSNYCSTMHRYSGEFAVVKVVSTSSDPEVIAQAEQEMQALTDWWNNRHVRPENPWVQSAGETHPIEPAKVKLLLGSIFSRAWTFLKFLGLSVLNLGRQAFKNRR